MITYETWMEKYNLLQKLLKRGTEIEAIKEIGLELHSHVHFAECSESLEPTVCDEIFDNLTDELFAAMPVKRCMTIAWVFWHLYRIEDLVSNIAINNDRQIFNDGWKTRINSGITDTANAQSYKEAVEMSKRINKVELKNYCIEVSKNTRKIISGFSPEQLKRKPSDEAMQRIASEGGLIQNKNSIWLKDFWGGRTIGGLLTIPLTKHHWMHLPDCLEIRTT